MFRDDGCVHNLHLVYIFSNYGQNQVTISIFFTVERRQEHLSLLLWHLIRVQDELFSTFRIGWPELPLFSKMAAPMNS